MHPIFGIQFRYSIKTDRMFRLGLVIISFLLFSCQQSGHKQNSSKNKPTNNSSFQLTSYQIKTYYASETPNPETTSATGNEINWLGSWHYEQDMVNYAITIDENFKKSNRCTYHVEGIPAYYVLACKGVVKGNVFELYYRYTHDGNFFKESKIDRHKPILTLALVNGKVITYGNQLPGGRNGQECIKKKA